VTIKNRSGVGFPENTTAQYIQTEPKRAQINAPRVLPFNSPALRPAEIALIVSSMRSF
jgi:hypothetical protein